MGPRIDNQQPPGLVQNSATEKAIEGLSGNTTSQMAEAFTLNFNHDRHALGQSQ
jgi:hypothetical protein